MNGIDLAPIRARIELDLAGFRAALSQAGSLMAVGSAGFGASMQGMVAAARSGTAQLQSVFVQGFTRMRTASAAQFTLLRSWFSGALTTLIQTANAGAPGMEQAGYRLYESMLHGMQAAFEQTKAFVVQSLSWIAAQQAAAMPSYDLGASAGQKQELSGLNNIHGLAPSDKSIPTTVENRTNNVSIQIKSGDLTEKKVARKVRSELRSVGLLM